MQPIEQALRHLRQRLKMLTTKLTEDKDRLLLNSHRFSPGLRAWLRLSFM